MSSYHDNEFVQDDKQEILITEDVEEEHYTESKGRVVTTSTRKGKEKDGNITSSKGKNVHDIDVDQKVCIFCSIKETEKLRPGNYRKYIKHLIRLRIKLESNISNRDIKNENKVNIKMEIEPLAKKRKEMNDVVHKIVANLMEQKYAMYPTTKV